MILSSPDFSDLQIMPDKYGKKGENISPPLSWEEAPAGTKSFALCMKDLHPVAKGLIHWLVINIDKEISALKEGGSGTKISENAKEIKTYMGPNPPSGTHDYEFTLYALKTETIEFPPKVSREEIGTILQKNSLTTAKLIGKFARQK